MKPKSPETSAAPEMATNLQLHPSTSPFKKKNTFLMGKKNSYSFLVHNIPIFSKKRSRVRIALQSPAWRVKTAHWDTELSCIICTDPLDLICIKKERVSSIICSKSTFNLKTHNIFLKLCLKQRAFFRHWRYKLTLLLLFNVAQIKIIQTSNL